MPSTIKEYLLILTIVLIETLAICVLKKYHLSNKILFFVLGVLLYAVVCYLLTKTFAYEGMALTNIIWSGLSILFVALAGVLYFKEQLTTNDMIGSILIVIGIMVLQLSPHGNMG